MLTQTQRAAMGQDSSFDRTDEEILSLFKAFLSEKDMTDAQNEVNEALSALKKAQISELRIVSKPDPLVERTLRVVSALKGFKYTGWNSAQEMLGKPSLKLDLMQLNPKNMRPLNVRNAQKILT